MMPLRHVAACTCAVFATVAAFAGFAWASGGLFAVLLAFVIANAAMPAIAKVSKVMPWMPRAVAAAAVLSVAGGLVCLGALVALPLLTTQADAVLEALPALCREAQRWSHAGTGWYHHIVEQTMPATCTSRRLLDLAWLSDRLGGGDSTLEAVQSSLVTFIIITALAFAWLRERDVALQGLRGILPPAAGDSVHSFVVEAERRMGRFVTGQLIVSATVFVVSFAVYKLLGLPNALGLGALAGALEVVPIIGPVVVAGLGVAVALTSARDALPGILGLAVGLRLAVDYLLGPLVVGRTAGVNSFLVILSLIAFGSVGGILGAMVAIPIAVLVQLAVERWLLAQGGNGADRSPALRYEARALVMALRRASWRPRSRALAVPDIDDEIEVCALAMVRGLDEQDEVVG